MISLFVYSFVRKETSGLLNTKNHSILINITRTHTHTHTHTLVYSRSYDETIRVWDMRMGRCLSTINAHSDPITGEISLSFRNI